MSEKQQNVKDNNERGLAKIEQQDVNLLSFKDLDHALVMCDKLAKSKFTPLDTKEDVLAALLLGEELGISKMIALNNVYSVNGKASIGFHIANGLLLRHGIVYDIVEDAVPVYSYFDIETKEQYTREELLQLKNEANQDYIIVKFAGDKEQRENQKKEFLKTHKGKIVVIKHPIDTRSTVKMIRNIKQHDGTYLPMTVIYSYYLSEVPTRLRSKEDQPWVCHTKQMLTHRTILIAARRIAGDVLNGMYEHTEMFDVHNIPYNYTDEGEIELLGNDGKVIKTMGNDNLEKEPIVEEQSN